MTAPGKAVKGWALADLFRTGDGYLLHEVDGVMVEEVYKDGECVYKGPPRPVTITTEPTP